MAVQMGRKAYEIILLNDTKGMNGMDGVFRDRKRKDLFVAEGSFYGLEASLNRQIWVQIIESPFCHLGGM
jgi:hypothetical protein